METVIKGFTGVFLLIMLTCMGVSVIASSIRSTNASRALLSYVNRIENSNYSDDVIAACEQDAAQEFGEDGQDALRVVKYRQSGRENVSYGKATLNYTYRIPVIGYDLRHTISSVMG